jgi:hypothetical protein
VAADAALLSKKNLEFLIEEGYKFIIGARIKNESNMYGLVYKLPASKDDKRQLLNMDPEQQLLYEAVHKEPGASSTKSGKFVMTDARKPFPCEPEYTDSDSTVPPIMK